MPKRLFIAMPYDTRENLLNFEDSSSRVSINFDDVWNGVISPAIPADFEAKRADELRSPGLIDKAYVEWLLEADVVLADLTFGNPNVYYELGIRQALARRGTVLVAQKGTNLPFDVRNQFVLNYDYFRAPSLPKFHNDLRSAIESAAAHEDGSPVHTFLPGLFIGRYSPGTSPAEAISALQAKIAILQKQIDDQDVRRLKEKVEEAKTDGALVGLARRVMAMGSSPADIVEELAIKLRKHNLLQDALKLLEWGLRSHPKDSDLLRETGFCYRKLGPAHFSVAKEYFQRALEETPDDPELLGMTGGLLKREGQLEKAAEMYEHARSLIPNDLYATIALAGLKLVLGLKTESRELYEQVAALARAQENSGKADHWTYLCWLEADVVIGVPEPSATLLEKLRDLNPPPADVQSETEQLEMIVQYIPADKIPSIQQVVSALNVIKNSSFDRRAQSV